MFPLFWSSCWSFSGSPWSSSCLSIFFLRMLRRIHCTKPTSCPHILELCLQATSLKSLKSSYSFFEAVSMKFFSIEGAALPLLFLEYRRPTRSAGCLVEEWLSRVSGGSGLTLCQDQRILLYSILCSKVFTRQLRPAVAMHFHTLHKGLWRVCACEELLF